MSRWAIGVQHEDGTVGYFLGDDRKVKTYSTEAEAERAMRKMLRNDGYSWNCDVRVFVYKDDKKKGARS